MDQKVNEEKNVLGNRIFYAIFIILILGSVGFTFLRIVIQKNYQIIAEVSCDPTLESCFHYDGVTCTEGDDTCVPEEAYDYKMISKSASNVYVCEQTEEKNGCNEELSCTDDELDCSYTLCDVNNLGLEEKCSDPKELQ